MYSFVVVGNVTKADPAQLYAQSNVLWAFLILGPTLNHSCNFFVYVMSNKPFRDELISTGKKIFSKRVCNSV